MAFPGRDGPFPSGLPGTSRALSSCARPPRADIFRALCRQPCRIAGAPIPSSARDAGWQLHHRHAADAGTPLAGHLSAPRGELAGRGARGERRSSGKAIRAPRGRRGGRGVGSAGRAAGERRRLGPARGFSTADSARRPGGEGRGGRTDRQTRSDSGHTATATDRATATAQGHSHGHARPATAGHSAGAGTGTEAHGETRACRRIDAQWDTRAHAGSGGTNPRAHRHSDTRAQTQ